MAIPLPLIPCTQQLRLGPRFDICPFFLNQIIASKNEKLSLERFFSPYSSLHCLALPSDSQPLTSGAALSSGHRDLLLGVFFMLPLGVPAD